MIKIKKNKTLLSILLIITFLCSCIPYTAVYANTGTKVYGSYKNFCQLPLSEEKNKLRTWIDYTVKTNNDDTYTLNLSAGFQINKGASASYLRTITEKMAGTGKATVSTNKSINVLSAQTTTVVSSRDWTWQKTHNAQTITITATLTIPNSSIDEYNVSKSFTIPAKSSYTVSYNANEGSGAPGNQTKWYGESLTLQSNIPTRTGYTFDGWNTKADGSGVNYTAGSSYSQNSALTLYAKWKGVSGKIKYDGNGSTSGTMEDSSFTYGSVNKLNPNKFKKEGYEFLCWNTEADGTGNDYMPQMMYQSLKTLFPSGSGTVYAKWIKKGGSKVKKNNPIAIKIKNINFKKKTIKKKNKTYKISKAIKVSKAKGTVIYTKISGNKKIKINNKTKKIIIKKGLKKGQYAVKVKITATGNKTFKAVNKTVSFKIKIK